LFPFPQNARGQSRAPTRKCLLPAWSCQISSSRAGLMVTAIIMIFPALVLVLPGL
jgi:hypothetical protein